MRKAGAASARGHSDQRHRDFRPVHRALKQIHDQKSEAKRGTEKADRCNCFQVGFQPVAFVDGSAQHFPPCLERTRHFLAFSRIHCSIPLSNAYTIFSDLTDILSYIRMKRKFSVVMHDRMCSVCCLALRVPYCSSGKRKGIDRLTICIYNPKEQDISSVKNAGKDKSYALLSAATGGVFRPSVF